MYDDAWYSIVPDNNRRETSSNQPRGHRRKESLLQQPNGPVNGVPVAEPLDNVYEELEDTNTPPEPALVRRAASYSDFYHVVKAQLSKDGQHAKRKKRPTKASRNWDALMLGDGPQQADDQSENDLVLSDSLHDHLLEASQQEYLLYRDQLALTERHLDSLIDDANATLKLLTSLSNSFQSVEAQTSTFRAQCEDLLSEQRRLEKLAHEVGTDIHYYDYLEIASRRLNAPGAGRLVDDEGFGDMLKNIDACIEFMETHTTYRDHESYAARYNALLTKALHLLDHGFTSRLDKVSADVARQLTAAKTESARHALAYGRFEEMILDTYSLLPNIHTVMRRVYDQWGRPVDSAARAAIYSTSASNMFQTYFSTRDRDLKQMTQRDVEEYQKEVKSLSIETASRNFIKQSFERVYNEEGLITKVFGFEPAWSNSPDSALRVLKTMHTSFAHPGNLAPIATQVQSVLQNAPLQTICDLVGWLASAYSATDDEDDESPFFRKCLEYTAQLLVDSLWPFTDNAFEQEITKSISKQALQDSALKIGPVEGGVASSNAHPLVKRAIELLVMFDQSMPKERSSKNSSVVFKIVRESIQVLQRAEARIKSLKTGTDPDLFMVKNLLIIKNELVSLEIGDIRSQTASMQHFGQIWDTLSPQNWIGFFGNIIGGSLWSRGAPSVTAKTLTVDDMSEQLDELLRQSIYAFTKRWATLLNDSQSRKPGVKPIAKVEAELESILQTAFSNQPEVIAKLKEAIQINAQAQNDAKDGKGAVKA